MRKSDSVQAVKNTTAPTLEEIIEEIKKSNMPAGNGFTTQELSSVSGHSVQWARDKVKLLMQNGKCKRSGKRAIETIDGRTYRITAYSLIEKEG